MTSKIDPESTTAQGDTTNADQEKSVKNSQKLPKTAEKPAREAPGRHPGGGQRGVETVDSRSPGAVNEPKRPARNPKRRSTKPAGRPKGSKDKRPRKSPARKPKKGSDSAENTRGPGNWGGQAGKKGIGGSVTDAGAAGSDAGGIRGEFPVLANQERVARARARLSTYLGTAAVVCKRGIPPPLEQSEIDALEAVWLPYFVEHIDDMEKGGAMPWPIVLLTTVMIFGPRVYWRMTGKKPYSQPKAEQVTSV